MSIPVSSPVGSGGRLERDGGHPAQLSQELGEQPLELEAPLAHLGRIQRMRPAKPGRPAAHSFTLGLYFMVHEPSG